MKRNHPPPDTERDRAEEEHLIDKRLKDTFTAPPCRKILLTNKATWYPEHNHVRLDEGLNAQQFDGMITTSSDPKCSYFSPFQALYLLESSQILIYHLEVPLSLAESYSLLLKGNNDLITYRVFSNLNQKGYFCFQSEFALPDKPADVPATEDSVGLVEDGEPLFRINSEYLTKQELLESLCRAGPKQANDETVDPSSSRFTFTFDIYKRETYAKNRIRRGKSKGRPDFHVVICDRATLDLSPSSLELASLSRRSDTDQVAFSGEILFALVDSNAGLIFVHFNSINPDTELNLIGSKTLPYQHHEDVAPDYKDLATNAIQDKVASKG